MNRIGAIAKCKELGVNREGLVQLEVGERAGLSEPALATLLTVLLFINYVTSLMYKHIRSFLGDRADFLIINFGMALGCLILTQVTGSVAVGVVGMFVFRLFGKFTQAWPSSVINESTPSEIRATTISTFAFITRAPFLLIVPIYMAFGDTGKSAVFMVFAFFLFVAGFLSLLLFNSFGG